ncbi:hypothetical protein [Mycolicibacterium holsaticum]|nr:hypothetical protein [Mycolicibacterium holsaticum]MDA4106013.1 hypothetical protein [Mycolicibacterium holsaticum DSM 44478 = JCM 12374]QZA13650.1 hypothetical protein K3U96_05750 [Mycolicibacterium holsaticum DSM 44478 = JCM 12374]UNC08886.1 hypothetical protein H5U41_21085 [Mycolicibacterium holsaticum DSM 44478 = JCM 12374]
MSASVAPNPARGDGPAPAPPTLKTNPLFKALDAAVRPKLTVSRTSADRATSRVRGNRLVCASSVLTLLADF